MSNYIEDAFRKLAIENDVLYEFEGYLNTEDDFNNNVTTDDGSDLPFTWADVQAKATELETAYNSAQYSRDREDAYPSIQDQLDMQYWDSVNGTTTWADAIAQVKADNPKPSE